MTSFLKPTDRIAVIAPHPDDETLGVGGILYDARQLDIPVSVIFLTSGDGNRVGTMQWFKRPLPRPKHYQAYATLREAEARLSLDVLGIQITNAHFLRFPDQGLKKILTPKYRQRPYRSRYTKATRSPAGVSFTGTLIAQLLQQTLAQINPTVLLLPMLEDSHADHQAAGKMAIKAAHSLELPPRKYAYPVHYRLFPKPRGTDSSLPLDPPKRHPRLDEWIRYPLSPEAISAKSRAVEQYVSQLQIPLLDTLMFSLVRTNELILPLR